jgi:hypothetical protein
MAENACSMGFKSGEYGGRKISLQPIVTVNTCNDKSGMEHTGFIFNKFLYFVCMMDVAII